MTEEREVRRCVKHTCASYSAFGSVRGSFFFCLMKCQLFFGMFILFSQKWPKLASGNTLNSAVSDAVKWKARACSSSALAPYKYTGRLVSEARRIQAGLRHWCFRKNYFQFLESGCARRTQILRECMILKLEVIWLTDIWWERYSINFAVKCNKAGLINTLWFIESHLVLLITLGGLLKDLITRSQQEALQWINGLCPFDNTQILLSASLQAFR